MALSAQISKSVGEPEAKQGDAHTNSAFTEKLWSTMPNVMTCRTTPSTFLPATPMQQSLKTCINLKTVSFLRWNHCLISHVRMYTHERQSQALGGYQWSWDAHRSYIQTFAVAQCCCWEVSQASSLAEGPPPALASLLLGFKSIPQQNAKCPQRGPVGVTLHEESKYGFSQPMPKVQGRLILQKEGLEHGISLLTGLIRWKMPTVAL